MKKTLYYNGKIIIFGGVTLTIVDYSVNNYVENGYIDNYFE